MSQTLGLSWDHEKHKLAAAIALLLVAISLAIAPAATRPEAGRSAKAEVSVGPVEISYTVMGSTLG